MGRTIMITGASRGIGCAIALKFANKGDTIIITCNKEKEKLEKVASEIRARGAVCYSVCCDLRDLYSVSENLFGIVRRNFLKLDLLINNAGVSHLGLLQDMTADEWDSIINTNLTSVFNCCHEAIPIMLRDGHGKIINISSIWGTYGASCEVAYSASKGGVNAFTKALAKELAPSNIQVNAVACGIIDTTMNAFLSPEDLALFEEDVATGRMATPSEVADYVYDLSNSGAYLTGQVIGFDGGYPA